MIRAKSYGEIQAILALPEFLSWHAKYLAASRKLRQLRAQEPDRLLALVFEAGEYDTLATEADAAYAVLDASFEGLAAFEEQRSLTSQAWTRLGSAEYSLAEQRSLAAEIKAQLVSKAGGENQNIFKTEASKLESDFATAEKNVAELDREVRRLREVYDLNLRKREELWRKVEDTWLKTFRVNMARIEYRFLARRARQASVEASGQFDSPELLAVDFETEIKAVQTEIQKLLSEAETLYECAAIAEFLYWPQADDLSAAWCVPLWGERLCLNLQVAQLGVYRVDRARGLDFIEPLSWGTEDAAQDERRLREFFARPT